MIVPQDRRSEDQCHHTESNRNQAVLTDLRRATPYEVQVRVHTAAGYGSFSPASVFHTLPDGEKSMWGCEVFVGNLVFFSGLVFYFHQDGLGIHFQLFFPNSWAVCLHWSDPVCPLSPFILSFSQDKTPSFCSLASLSLPGCCFSSHSSLWPPTAYGENWGKGKATEKMTAFGRQRR